MQSHEEHLTDDQLLSAAEGHDLPRTSLDHLASCIRCRTELNKLRTPIRAMEETPPPALTRELRERLLERFEGKRRWRWALPRILTWRMPVYQAAGLAAAAVVLWSLLAAPRPRPERTTSVDTNLAFNTALSDGVGGAFVAGYVTAHPDSV